MRNFALRNKHQFDRLTDTCRQEVVTHCRRALVKGNEVCIRVEEFHPEESNELIIYGMYEKTPAEVENYFSSGGSWEYIHPAKLLDNIDMADKIEIVTDWDRQLTKEVYATLSVEQQDEIKYFLLDVDWDRYVFVDVFQLENEPDLSYECFSISEDVYHSFLAMGDTRPFLDPRVILANIGIEEQDEVLEEFIEEDVDESTAEPVVDIIVAGKHVTHLASGATTVPYRPIGRDLACYEIWVGNDESGWSALVELYACKDGLWVCFPQPVKGNYNSYKVTDASPEFVKGAYIRALEL